MQADDETELGTQCQRDSARLGGPHHRAEVVLRKHALDGHGRRPVLVQCEADTAGNRKQSLLKRHGWRRLDHAQ